MAFRRHPEQAHGSTFDVRCALSNDAAFTSEVDFVRVQITHRYGN